MMIGLTLMGALLACKGGSSGGCTSNADCAVNTFCNAGRCVANPVPVAATPAAAPAQAPAPVATVPKTVTEGALELGKHGCTMRDGTGAYNRICDVSRRPDGSVRVRAAGTRLNPTIGFEFDATGGPDSYHIKGKMTAFDSCSGRYETSLAKEDIGGSDWYVATFKHCKIMVRAEAL